MAFEKLGVELSVTGLSKSQRDLGEFNKAIGNTGKGADESNKSLKNMALGIAAGLLTYQTFTKVLEFSVEQMKLCVKYAAENETAMSRLNSTLSSTGRGAEITSKQIEKIANSLMKTSAFDDEDIINAYNAMAKFDNIDTASLESVVKVAMDLTAILGGDLASNANEIARVLETGLIPRSWGFSEAMKEQVKQLVASGNSGKALNVILKELNNRFGGQAQAELDTYAGKVKKADIALSELGEGIGKGVLPATKKLQEEWLTLIENASMVILSSQMINDVFQDHEMEIRKASKTWEEYTQEMRRAFLVSGGLIEGTQGFNIRMNELKNSLDGGAKAAGYLSEQEYELWKASQTATEGLKNQIPILDEIAIDYSRLYKNALDAAKEFGNFNEKLIEAQTELAKAEETLNEALKTPLNKQAIIDAQTEVDKLKERITDLKEEHRLAMLEMEAGWIELALTADGVFDEVDVKKMLDWRLAVGLLSQAEYDAAVKAWLLGAAIAGIPPGGLWVYDFWYRTYYTTYYNSTPVTGAGINYNNPSKLPGSTAKDTSGMVTALGQTTTGSHYGSGGLFAEGGQMPYNGWSVVGEKGLELVGPGGMVFSHGQSMQMLSSIGGLGGFRKFAEGSYPGMQIGQLISGPQRSMSSSMTNNYNYSPSYGSAPNNPIFDFAIMQARSMA